MLSPKDPEVKAGFLLSLLLMTLLVLVRVIKLKKKKKKGEEMANYLYFKQHDYLCRKAYRVYKL